MDTNQQTKDLALQLLHADSEEEVVALLKGAGYWDSPQNWRLYGDKEGNFAQAGNQQSLPEAALVEKIVNCVDARLQNECLKADIPPESESAPTSVRDAVAMFFEGRRATDEEAGTLINWPQAERTEQSRLITVAATGGKPTRGHKTKKMCLTIVDQGEGQSARRLPHTILSLNARNKQRIKFVQGKFNMGGSGALRFCGRDGIQLVISKRNPELAAKDGNSDPTIGSWAVTVVRREEPGNKSGEPLHSEFTYLAPVHATQNPRKGEVLSFNAESLPLMPTTNEAYSREIQWGTAIKLYEYETSIGQSNVVLPDGLLYSLERLLPEIALPVRIHECRSGYKGAKDRSFETPLSGLVVRLEDGKGDNLEPGFPVSVSLRAAGMNMSARIYAFREARAKTYLKNEGVIFSINGQSHGHLPKSIFSRPKAVGLPRLKDSLLVLVDCSSLTPRQREDLFMSSRDRLSKNPIRYQVEAELENMLKHHRALRELQQARRQQDVESKLSGDKPLEEVLGKLLKASPTLNTLFLRGQRLARPFQKGGGGSGKNSERKKTDREKFKGKRHPTYFHFEQIEYGRTLRKNCEQGRRVRVTFTTDVENEYFDRATDRGSFEIESLDPDVAVPSSGNCHLDSGYGRWSFELPEGAQVGESYTFQTTVIDPTLAEPFINIVEITVVPKKERPSGPNKPRKRKGAGGGDSEGSQGLTLPRAILVHEGDDYWTRHNFDHATACHVISEPTDDSEQPQMEHVFYINADNDALKTEMKYSRQDARLLQAKFKYANVLLGLAMLHDYDAKTKETQDEAEPECATAREEDDTQTVQDRIRAVSEAMAPVLLPMIDKLSGLKESDLQESSEAGDDE